MPISYDKPWLSFQEQLEQLQTRGLAITDNNKAVEYLERIGYYRLSGYWYPFRVRSEACCSWDGALSTKRQNHKVQRLVLDQFQPGATFKNAVELYVFDKKLRLLALDALERIEVALRVDLSHLLGQRGSDSYLWPDNFADKFAKQLDNNSGLSRHHKWLNKHASLINRSNEEFIKHNKTKYGLPVSVWVACEVWDFGTLSTLYSGLKPEDQALISSKYDIANGQIFASWLRSLNYLRNVCAHHSRLWNRNIVDQAKLPPKGTIDWLEPFYDNRHSQARPFLQLCMVRHLMAVINPDSSWSSRMTFLLQDFPNLDHLGLNLRGMGVIDGVWEGF